MKPIERRPVVNSMKWSIRFALFIIGCIVGSCVAGGIDAALH